MDTARHRLLATVALVMLPVGAAFAQAAPVPVPVPAPVASASAIAAPVGDDIIVTARRSNERLQNVPVAVSILTPATLNSKGTFTPTDLTASVPGLSVAASVADRNNVTYSIRGQGFSYGTLFPAVITYFNEVPITQLTAGQFFDLANVQVLRGPQGVTFGRVTDGGNVMVAAQEPKDEFGGYAQVKLGDYAAKVIDGALNVPIVKDRILFRGAFEIGRRDGFTDNIYNGKDLDNVRYESYRVGLTINLTDTLTNTTTVAYQHTRDNGTSNVATGLNPATLTANYAVAGAFPGVYGIDAIGNVVPFAPGLTPFTAANFVASQEAQLANQQTLGPRKVYQAFPSFDRRKNLYVVNTTRADLTDNVQLTNIFGYIDVQDDEASSYSGLNGNVVGTCHSACGTGGGLLFNSQKQYSEELRLSGKVFDNRLSWSIGGYADKQDPGGRAFENDTINVSILERDSVQYATTTSKAVYASGEYDLEQLLPGLKVNGGVRYTHDTVASANATYLRPLYLPDAIFGPIPHGVCTSYPDGAALGSTDCTVTKSSFNATTWQGGLSYKRGSGPLFYGKASKGYRPGGVNGSAPVGVDPAYNPEYDLSIEIGIKSQFYLGGTTFRANIAAYHDRYTDIQKNVVVPGPVPVSLERNIDNARVKGVEFDGAIIPFHGLNLGGSFAYTHAKFDRNKPYDVNSCDPTAAFITGFCPFNRFAYTPKFQYTLSADYAVPLSGDAGKLSFGAQWYHQSSIALNDTSALNPASIEKPYGYLNLTAGWDSIFGRPLDLGFFMTNVTNRLYRIGSNDLTQASSIGSASSIYAPPRMFGFSLKYRFGSDAR